MVFRRQRFFVLEKIILPIVILPLRLLVRSWRKEELHAAVIRQITDTPRVILVTFHGMQLHLLAFAANCPRQIVVMVSPSYDGRLLAAFLKYFGIRHVFGSSRSRRIAGSLELIRYIKAGAIGLIAVDGPRGPRCIAKPGFLKIASAAKASLLLATSSASSGISFKTWDRTHLPTPFARVRLSLQLFPRLEMTDPVSDLSIVQERLISSARKMGSPVL